MWGPPGSPPISSVFNAGSPMRAMSRSRLKQLKEKRQEATSKRLDEITSKLLLDKVSQVFLLSEKQQGTLDYENYHSLVQKVCKDIIFKLSQLNFNTVFTTIQEALSDRFVFVGVWSFVFFS